MIDRKKINQQQLLNEIKFFLSYSNQQTVGFIGKTDSSKEMAARNYTNRSYDWLPHHRNIGEVKTGRKAYWTRGGIVPWPTRTICRRKKKSQREMLQGMRKIIRGSHRKRDSSESETRYQYRVKWQLSEEQQKEADSKLRSFSHLIMAKYTAEQQL